MSLDSPQGKGASKQISPTDMDTLFPIETESAAARRKIYHVTELTRRIKATLEDDFGSVWVEGEVSGAKLVGSGHLYFTLKDETAQLAVAFFSFSRSGCKVEVKDGAKLRVFGRLTVYEPRGQYQLIVQKIEAAGQGSLQEAFEKLKERLNKEGLFDPARKRQLPVLPRHLGIVTSPTGAAIRDMLQILGRRFPNLHIVIAPARVQGEGSAAEIAEALDLLNQRDDLDVLIVGRGGGSLEDLWSFNEEVVARAIARSRLPVISAVGHEIDFTISDFVADVRAPTPSAAAELVVRPKADFEKQVTTLRRHLASAPQERLLTLRNRLVRAGHSYVFREPGNLLQRHRQLIRQLREQLRRALLDRGRDQRQRLDEASSSLGQSAELILQRRRQSLPLLANRLTAALPRACEREAQKVERAALRMKHPLLMAVQRARQMVAQRGAQLRAFSPLAVLERGYSITQKQQGDVVRDASDLKAGERLATRLARGLVISTVNEVERNPDHVHSKGA